MRSRDLVYVGHMRQTAEKIAAKVANLPREDFDRDENLRLALTHLLQIVGEAASRISEEFRREHPEIPWKGIVGMRQKVVHDYLGVDENVVWRTATAEIPRLLETLARIQGTGP